MLKASTSSRAPGRRRGKAAASGGAAAAPTARDYADALARVAGECCHQHDRYARVVDRSRLEIEERSAGELCRAGDEALAGMLEAYEASVAANGRSDEPWARSASALWMAAREFTRRTRGTDAITRRLPRHSAGTFGALRADFELDASALLALRHACEAYERATAGEEVV